MDGLLLQLLEDKGNAGAWFWPCFEPLKRDFDNYYWIIDCQLWMGPPLAFFDESGHNAASVDDPRLHDAQVQLWRPGAIGRWASEFEEESLYLWALQEHTDPIEMALRWHHTSYDRPNSFVEAHASVLLQYTDSTCWEIFARDHKLLDKVRRHTQSQASIRAYQTFSQNRRFGFKQIGVPDSEYPPWL
jgi:hypothetical protein